MLSYQHRPRKSVLFAYFLLVAISFNILVVPANSAERVIDIDSDESLDEAVNDINNYDESSMVTAPLKEETNQQDASIGHDHTSTSHSSSTEVKLNSSSSPKSEQQHDAENVLENSHQPLSSERGHWGFNTPHDDNLEKPTTIHNHATNNAFTPLFVQPMKTVTQSLVTDSSSVPEIHNETSNRTHEETTQSSSSSSSSSKTENSQIPSHDRYYPPEGFQLTAHIVTNHNNGLSYFADTIPSMDITTNQNTSHSHNTIQNNNNLLIPFLECKAVGSTTASISLKNGYFHQFPNGAHPTSFTPATEVHLLIVLSKIEITVSGNNEESRIFDKGNVLLVEDLLSKGHKMRSAFSSNNYSNEEDNDDASVQKDLSVFIVNLPPTSTHHHHHHHHHPAPKQHQTISSKDNIIDSKRKKSKVFGFRNRTNLFQKSKEPCIDDYESSTAESVYSILGVKPPHKNDDDEGGILVPFVDQLKHVPMRRVLLTSVGFSFSTMITYFLSKVAPLQLAVGVGGICILGGGTYGIVKGGEWICDEVDVWLEKKRLLELEDGEYEDLVSVEDNSDEETEENVSVNDDVG